MRVTGNMVNYFFVCKRKLWLFQHQIGFEQTSERVQLGSLLDRTSYQGHGTHHVMIDNLINIDMVENWHCQIVKKFNARNLLRESGLSEEQCDQLMKEARADEAKEIADLMAKYLVKD